MTASGGRATARQEPVDVEGAVRRALLCGDCGNPPTSVVSDGDDAAGGPVARFLPEIGGVRADVVARLAHLVELWRHYGRSMNLVAQHGAMESVERQLGESVLVARLGHELGLAWRGVSAEGSGASLAEAPRWLDVGSGAGFPGLVIAAMLDIEVWLVEPRAKRATFLELALATIRGRGRVVRGRLESLGADVADARPAMFGFASARAVFSPEEWVAKATPWVRPGGWVIVETHDDTVVRIPAAGETGVAVEHVVRVDAPPWSVRGLRRVGGQAPPGR